MNLPLIFYLGITTNNSQIVNNNSIIVMSTFETLKAYIKLYSEGLSTGFTDRLNKINKYIARENIELNPINQLSYSLVFGQLDIAIKIYCDIRFGLVQSSQVLGSEPKLTSPPKELALLYLELKLMESGQDVDSEILSRFNDYKFSDSDICNLKYACFNEFYLDSSCRKYAEFCYDESMQLEVLIWFCSTFEITINDIIESYFLIGITLKGRFKLLEWANNTFNLSNSTRLCCFNIAVKRGHIDVATWIYNSFELSDAEIQIYTVPFLEL